MKFPGIVRNRLKIESAINNARSSSKCRRARHLCQIHLVLRRRQAHRQQALGTSQVPATAGIGRAQQGLKQRGFRFVGSTIIYAHMQATGMVNDHLGSASATRRRRASGDPPLRDAIARAAAMAVSAAATPVPATPPVCRRRRRAQAGA